MLTIFKNEDYKITCREIDYRTEYPNTTNRPQARNYTFTRREDLNLFVLELHWFGETEDDILTCTDYITFWADTEKNALNFLKRNLLFLKNSKFTKSNYDELEYMFYSEFKNLVVSFVFDAFDLTKYKDFDDMINTMHHYCYCTRKLVELYEQIKSFPEMAEILL